MPGSLWLATVLALSLAFAVGTDASSAGAQTVAARTDAAQTVAAHSSPTRIVLLGTGAGPIARKFRSQPANLLVVNGKPYMIDAGNGVVRQLALAGYEPADVRTIFITHHHLDHNGDLGAMMSFAWMADNQRHAAKAPPIQIYGPPATSQIVAAALGYLSVSERIFGAEAPMAPTTGRFEAHDIASDGVVFQDANVRVTAAENSHFNIPPTAPSHGVDKSYSYRFDAQDRSVVFAGDTGPSEALVKLARGADVLVSEVADLDATMRVVGETMRLPPPLLLAMRTHMEHEHLTPEAVGRLARDAQVKAVILTHLSPGGDDETDASRYTEGVRKYFSGPVIAGRDLFEF